LRKIPRGKTKKNNGSPEGLRDELIKMRDAVNMEAAKKRKSPVATARANLIKFCEILDDLPVNFNFTLSNPSMDYYGCWRKVSLDGKTTAWHNGSKVLLNSSFFPIKREVIEAIEREGRQVGKLFFSEKKPKKTPRLTKEGIEELYYRKKKSLQEIARGYGYSRQFIMLLMEKYGLKRRTRLEARKEAINKKE
jgi:hypothetical protein